ncbi:MAG: coproporphyrinogen dehydrogenase, partial [Burkholderiales bacterium]|nr:coproporphyrinogen dehydrogenase [Burkholderiales bacterium]
MNAVSQQELASALAVVDQIEIDEELIRRFNKLGPRYTSYPSADRFEPSFSAADYIAQLQQRASNPSKPPLSLYIHIPFCQSLCYYCACNKVITKHRSKSAEYLHYLQKELALLQPYLQANSAEKQVATQLHLGGGTPTFLSNDEMAQLMQMLRQYVQFTPDAEIGIEIDPRTVTPESLAFYASLGFNRTSLGVQDFDLAVQQAVHRIQPYEMIETALRASRENGFRSINFDLIYGLPKQSLASFEATIDQVIALAPDR